MTDAPQDPIDTVLRDAALWGLELDPRYRVLAVTLEPVTGRVVPAGPDARLQLLCFPVSTILASLRSRDDAGRVTLRTFTSDQLIDVAAAFGGRQVEGPLLGRPEPRPGEWGPRFSLEGRSTAPDGTRTTLTLSLRDGRDELDVFARFDEVEVRDADGREVDLSG